MQEGNMMDNRKHSMKHNRRHHYNQNQNHRQQQQRPMRMKCVVLGSAGAGKTSYLRRYFTGKFEHNYRKSTLGADFYSTVISNPYYDEDTSDVSDNETNDNIDQYQYNNHDSCSNCSGDSMSLKTASSSSPLSQSSNQNHQSKTHRNVLKTPNEELGSSEGEKRKHKKKKSKKRKKKKSTKRRDRNSPMMMIPELSDGTSTANVSVSNSMVDGAFASNNCSVTDTNTTTTTNRHHHKMRVKRKHKNIRQSKQIALQMWDTAGKERFNSAESTKGLLTSRLGDAFFTHADVAILIYDATSSKSFLQLIQWYSELLDRVKKINSDEETGDGYKNSEKNNDNDGYCMSSKGKFPVLIVATKLDRLKAELSRQARKKIVPQRDVLGLRDKGFNGQEYHYEYTVSSSSISSRNATDRKSSNVGRKDISHIKDVSAPLSYGLEGGAWTSDTEYLDYLGVAEDASFPDRYMVLLWCKRNGLKHVEVSALDGMGVNETVKRVVDLAIDSISEKKTVCNNSGNKLDQRKGPIDFHEKSGLDQEDNCNFCRWFMR